MAGSFRYLGVFLYENVCVSVANWIFSFPQTCMEMTNPICGDGISDMFRPSSWDPVRFSDYCFTKFGVRPRMDWAGVQWRAKDLKNVDRLIFR